MSPRERDDNQRSADIDGDEDTKPDAEPTAGSDVEPTPPPAPPPTEAEQPTTHRRRLTPTRASGLWAGLIVAAIVLIFLLVFILQNLDEVEISFLMFSGRLPIGIAVLLSAIAGILMVAVPGMARMIQLRRQAKR